MLTRTVDQWDSGVESGEWRVGPLQKVQVGWSAVVGRPADMDDG